MTGVLTGFGAIAAVIALGLLLAHVKLIDEPGQQTLTRLSFFVAMPCLLLSVLSSTPVGEVLSRPLAATFGGVLLAALPYLVVARWVWRRAPDEVAIGTLCSAYCNAGNLGIPVAAYVLGDAALVAPMLLLNLVVLQPLALAVLDAGRSGRPSWRTALRAPFSNPLTLATIAGVALSATGWRLPTYMLAPIDLVGGLAVPAVLLAYGASLRLGPPPGRGTPPAELAFVATLKLAVQPLGAYLAGRALGLEGPALLALAVTAALPSAQNIFVHAYRFGRAQLLARNAILVTTIGSLPAITIITLLLT